MDIASATNGRAGSYRRLADGLRAFLPRPLPPDPPLDMDEPLQVLLDRSAGNALRLHEQLFATPIIGVARAAECLGIGFAAANRLIDRMVDCGVLRELTGHRRNRRFAYQCYIDLFAD